MTKVKYNLSTDPEIREMLREMAAADDRDMGPWLNRLIKREYAKFKAAKAEVK